MAFIPKAVCVTCRVPYRIEKTGLTMHAYTQQGYYYSIECDKWRCPSCGHEILRGFTDHPWQFRHNVKNIAPLFRNQPEIKVDL